MNGRRHRTPYSRCACTLDSPFLSVFDASAHDYAHARSVSPRATPDHIYTICSCPLLIFLSIQSLPPHSCAVLSFCVSLTQVAQAFSIIINTPPEPLRCARCSSLYLYLYLHLCSCPASRRSRDGPAHSGCTRIPPSSHRLFV